MKMQKIYTVTIAETNFSTTRGSKRKINAYLRKVRYTPKLPYKDYPEDMESALRDLLLASHNSAKKPITEKDVEKAVKMLGFDQIPSKWGLPRRLYVKYMTSRLSPAATSKFIRTYKMLIKNTLLMIMLVLVSLWLVGLIFTLIAGLNMSNEGLSMINEDVMAGGPFNVPLFYTRITSVHYIKVSVLILYVCVLFTLLLLALFKKNIRFKVLLTIFVAATLLYTMFSYVYMSREYEPGMSSGRYELAVCNGRIQYLNVANTANGSNQFYELIRSGWQLAAVVPQDVLEFNESVCDQYFSLQANHSNEDIILIPIMFNSSNQPVPFYYDNFGNYYEVIRYGWCVK